MRGGAARCRIRGIADVLGRLTIKNHHTIYFTTGSRFRTCTGHFTRGAATPPTTPISPEGFPAP